MITSRDLEIVEFVETYKVASMSLIQHFFFPSRNSCQKRLKRIVDAKLIKRARDNVNREYIYYVKRPKQLNHSLKVTEMYKYLGQKLEIVKFKIEPQLGSIRPDAIFGFNKNGKSYIGMLEVELSKKGLDLNKYDRFIKTNECCQYGFTNFYLFVWRNGKVEEYGYGSGSTNKMI